MLDNILACILDLIITAVVTFICGIIGQFLPEAVQPFMVGIPLALGVINAFLVLCGIGGTEPDKTDKEIEYDNIKTPTRRKRS